MGNTQSYKTKSQIRRKSGIKREHVKPFEDQGPFRYINGKRYHNDRHSHYSLPCGDDECDRLQMQHFLLRFLWDGNFSAPIEEKLKKGIKVLDVGCGPGTWVLDMASAYPNSHFYGIDIAPVFPSAIKPVNVTFLKANAFDLPFSDEFDFVHLQLAALNFTQFEWTTRVLPELLRVTRPNGYLEIFEFDFRTYNPPQTLVPIMEAYLRENSMRGINLSIGECLEQMLTSTNMVTDLQHIVHPMLYTEQSGRAGEISKDNTLLFYRVVAPRICKLLGITEEHYIAMLDKIDDEFEEQNSYNNMHKVIVRKHVE